MFYSSLFSLFSVVPITLHQSLFPSYLICLSFFSGVQIPALYDIMNFIYLIVCPLTTHLFSIQIYITLVKCFSIFGRSLKVYLWIVPVGSLTQRVQCHYLNVRTNATFVINHFISISLNGLLWKRPHIGEGHQQVFKKEQTSTPHRNEKSTDRLHYTVLAISTRF